ncbi:hypothetical protein H5V43_21910 (plasmid) [Sphingobium fuliginis]|jgi:hypothetical protein|uniref:DUF6915 domain-containing protein n=1 Tax=Sphingobium fuliginis (strain ATCC 27551) TaxID=336203 RepID=A0A7M2GRL1_SPHSA|nr:MULTISPECIES: hypothetical protein [Sphingobium]QOT74529.1 hypothetical protein H5V43_21910 [Sphingobium fuliginis]
MNPFDHARSSARIHGGRWQDYHALHAWFDASKATHCHFSHRALRHHHEGIAEAEMLFGLAIRNADGALVSLEAVARQHIEEDCRYLPAAADWLADFDMPDWFTRPSPDPFNLARTSALRFGGELDSYLPLHQWFLATRDWVDGPAHFFFRHHAFGIYEAEHRFGPAIDNGSGGIATRVVAEQHVRSILGRLPAAPDVLRRLKGQRWMLQAASAEKIGLD